MASAEGITTGKKLIVATASVGVTVILRLLMWRYAISDSPFPMFLTSVAVAAWYGGWLGGLYATLLSIVAGNYFFAIPYFGFNFISPEQRLQIVIFIGESTLITVLCENLRKINRKLVAQSAENRTLQQGLLEIAEAEQRRIGHDLHDGLGQQLTGIAMIARRLEQRLGAVNSPESAEATSLSSLAKASVEWTHDLCRTLSPIALEKQGLAEALCELATNAESLFDIECAFHREGGADIRDVAEAVHVYRIVQEAISNAVKHGRADRVRISLNGVSGSILIEVQDNGRGIQANQSQTGMGMRIMHYRARMIGAKLDIRGNNTGSGTTVTCICTKEPRYVAG